MKIIRGWYGLVLQAVNQAHGLEYPTVPPGK
jgi:hypothetical protein